MFQCLHGECICHSCLVQINEVPIYKEWIGCERVSGEGEGEGGNGKG